MKYKFSHGDKVRFIDSYDGVFRSFKDETLTVLWYHNQAECGEIGGRVKIVEIQEVIQYHLINPQWLEPVKTEGMLKL